MSLAGGSSARAEAHASTQRPRSTSRRGRRRGSIHLGWRSCEGELALVARDQILPFSESEIILGHHHPSQPRARTALAASAVTVSERLRVSDLVFDTSTQAGSPERVSHRNPLSSWR
jgi:hypothetical protein